MEKIWRNFWDFFSKTLANWRIFKSRGEGFVTQCTPWLRACLTFFRGRTTKIIKLANNIHYHEYFKWSIRIKLSANCDRLVQIFITFLYTKESFAFLLLMKRMKGGGGRVERGEKSTTQNHQRNLKYWNFDLNNTHWYNHDLISRSNRYSEQSEVIGYRDNYLIKRHLLRPKCSSMI